MFIQVIEGRLRDERAMRRQLDLWRSEVGPHAVGYLGSTHGASSDGTWISVVRFDSRESARRNSQRPEQDAWWAATTGLFDGEIRVDDCTEVDIIGRGDPDEAGFVQVLRGRATSKAALRDLLEEVAPTALEGRPHIIGSVYGWHGDRFVTTVYFTSEAAAREGEQQEPPPHLHRWRELVDDLRFMDLASPILLSPADR